MEKQNITRLAPSPTGQIHLGNAWSFLLCWLAARSTGGKVILRMDDIDPQRSRREYEKEIVDNLRWLGLDWDNGIDAGMRGFYRQSERLGAYEEDLQKLSAQNLVYPCFCTRREIRQLAAAPHIEDWGVPYPGTCAALSEGEARRKMDAGAAFAMRLRCFGRPVEFDDLVMGPQKFEAWRYGNDFALKRSDGVFAYQLATAIDDAAMGVNLVARGADLLSSTPRQLIILRYLGYPAPHYAHIPLLLDGEGERLAKRHASLSISALQKKGVSSETIIGYLARLAGMNESGKPCSPADLLEGFSWERLPKENIRINANKIL